MTTGIAKPKDTEVDGKEGVPSLVKNCARELEVAAPNEGCGAATKVDCLMSAKSLNKNETKKRRKNRDTDHSGRVKDSTNLFYQHQARRLENLKAQKFWHCEPNAARKSEVAAPNVECGASTQVDCFMSVQLFETQSTKTKSKKKDT